MSVNEKEITDRQIEEELKKSFLDYSMSVIVSRALPDVRDGLKPVHRRILYSMWSQKMNSSSGFYKSARIVGDVIGRYHPHGDSSVYEALVRMAQPWSLIAPLADRQGHFGSLDGDGAAAMRYTESRMSKISEELLKNIEKNNVPFRENYDGKEKEPVVFPSRFPNLLVNGSSGIAVGMATNMPTHNLSEVCETTIRLINNPDLTTEELMETLPGPDFPTGGIILGDEGIKKAYEKGNGSFSIRGEVKVEETSEGYSVVITKLPYQINKSNLIRSIREIQTLYDEFRRKTRSRSRRNFSIEKPGRALDFARRNGINDQSDTRSDETNVRIVIHLKDGVDPRVVINHLYKYTPLQISYSINNTVLTPTEKGGLQPRRLGLKDLLNEYIKHQLEVIENELNFDLKKHQKEIYELTALIKALDKLDETIDIIRNSNSNQEAIEGLVKLLSIESEQARTILDKRIRTLTMQQQDETKDRYDFLKSEVKKIESILSDEEKMKELIISELTRIQKDYGKPRETTIGPPAEDLNAIDLIQNDQIVTTLSKNGYIKASKEENFKSQRRNGRGVNAMNLDDDDIIIHLEIMYKHDNLLLFTNLGKVYKLRGYDIPESNTSNKGVHLFNLLPGLEDDEFIQSVIAVKEFSDDQFLFFTTSKGIVKKTNLSQYENIRRNGIIAITLDENDELVNVSLTDGNMNIIIVTSQGKCITFKESDVRPTSRNTQGVIGVRLTRDDFVVSSDIHEKFGDLFIVTENGYGKKTPLNEFKTQRRGGVGVIALNSNKRTGNIISTLTISEEDSVYILSTLGSMIKIHANQISRFGRTAQGTRVINLRENDKATSIARLSHE